ncbi:MAG: type II secretion system F family protein [Planctomycetaceae bacterium]|nr:type II secretion system F family protein [Planctomycetaceae bacterium]
MAISWESLLPWLIFVSTFSCVLATAWLLRSRKGSADDRLDTLRTRLLTSTAELPQRRQLVAATSQVLCVPFQPRSEAELEGLKKGLAAAGFQSTGAVAAFATVRLLSLIAGASCGSMPSLLQSLDARYQPLLLLVGLTIGLYLPGIVLRTLAKRRQKRILKALPDTLDLLIISIEVGQALDTALRNIVEHLSLHGADLCVELRTFLNQLNMGKSRREALQSLGARSGVAELNSLAAVLIQADRFGSSISDSLRDLSEAIRIRRRHLAEEKAQQAAVKLIFPLVLFIFPGIFAVLVGPAAISLYRDFVAAP